MYIYIYMCIYIYIYMPSVVHFRQPSETLREGAHRSGDRRSRRGICMLLLLSLLLIITTTIIIIIINIIFVY